jgi:hypothetical protein
LLKWCLLVEEGAPDPFSIRRLITIDFLAIGAVSIPTISELLRGMMIVYI